MTLGEWVNSDYNTGGFTLNNGNIYLDGETISFKCDYDYIKANASFSMTSVADKCV